MANRYKHQTQKLISARFNIRDYLDIEAEAEALGTTIADVVRVAWKEYSNKKSVEEYWDSLERRLVNKIFYIFIAALGLNEIEVNEAKLEVEKILGMKL